MLAHTVHTGRDTHVTAERRKFARTVDLLMPGGFVMEISHIQGWSFFLTPGQKKDQSFQQPTAPPGVLTCRNREYQYENTKYIWSKFKCFDKNPSYINVQTHVNLDLKPLYKIPGYLIIEQTL